MFGIDPNCFKNVDLKTSDVVFGHDKVAQLSCLPSTILAVANGFLIFSGATALFIIGWSALRMITSGGDAKQLEGLKKSITFAIIGLIVVLSSFAIVNFIGYLTKTSTCVTNINSILTGCI